MADAFWPVADRREEVITTLLEWYVDVLNGVRDGIGDDPTHLPLMCAAWNHPRLP